MFNKEEQMKKQLKELQRKQLRGKEMKIRKRLVCLRLLLRLIILYLVVIDKGRYGHISFFRQNKNVLPAGVIFFPILNVKTRNNIHLGTSHERHRAADVT